MSIVVVVEDSLFVASFYVDLLADQGYDARLFLDGARFLDALATLSPDLLILDRNMPKLDGLELARRVRAQRPDLPILMISGVPAAGAARDGIIDRCLVKPCTIPQFVGAVSELLGRPCPAAGGSPSRATG
jgi:two-component system alkaline phosphatase synthesis response regulator PhoP